MPDTYSRRTEAYRTPDECYEHLPDWPFEARYLLPDGLRMHFVVEGEGDPALLLHGEPTCAFLYCRLNPMPETSGRLFAPDLFDFGRSDRPLRTSDYQFAFHYRSIERFLLELELRRLTSVGHARAACGTERSPRA
jgi:haloalkane dehalogenase